MENKYQRRKIYKIWSPNTDQIYIGSTCKPTLACKLAGHIRVFNGGKAGKQPYISSFEILKDPECRITLLETFSCNSKDELTAKGQFYIDQNYNICINQQKAYAGIKTGLTKQKYKAIYNQQYCKEHKKVIKHIKSNILKKTMKHIGFSISNTMKKIRI
jgi:hypothetical protein